MHGAHLLHLLSMDQVPQSTSKPRVFVLCMVRATPLPLQTQSPARPGHDFLTTSLPRFRQSLKRTTRSIPTPPPSRLTRVSFLLQYR